MMRTGLLGYVCASALGVCRANRQQRRRGEPGTARDGLKMSVHGGSLSLCAIVHGPAHAPIGAATRPGFTLSLRTPGLLAPPLPRPRGLRLVGDAGGDRPLGCERVHVAERQRLQQQSGVDFGVTARNTATGSEPATTVQPWPRISTTRESPSVRASAAPRSRLRINRSLAGPA